MGQPPQPGSGAVRHMARPGGTSPARGQGERAPLHYTPTPMVPEPPSWGAAGSARGGAALPAPHGRDPAPPGSLVLPGPLQVPHGGGVSVPPARGVAGEGCGEQPGSPRWGWGGGWGRRSEGGFLHSVGGGPSSADVALPILFLPPHGARGRQTVGHPIALHRGVRVVGVLPGQSRGGSRSMVGDTDPMLTPTPPPGCRGLRPSPAQGRPPRSRAAAGTCRAGSRAGEAAPGRWCGGPRPPLVWGLGGQSGG